MRIPDREEAPEDGFEERMARSYGRRVREMENRLEEAEHLGSGELIDFEKEGIRLPGEDE